MFEESWKNRFKIFRALQERKSEGKISQELLTLFVRWLSMMDRHEKIGNQPWIDTFFIYLALPEKDQYTFLAQRIEHQLSFLEKRLEVEKAILPSSDASAFLRNFAGFLSSGR